MTQAYLALRAAGEDLDDPGLGEDPEDDPPPDVDPGELAGEADQITGELAREAVLLARLGLTGAIAAGGRRGRQSTPLRQPTPLRGRSGHHSRSDGL